MSAQRIFTEKYVKILEKELHDGIGIDRYYEAAFKYDISQVRINPKIHHPENLKKFNATDAADVTEYLLLGQNLLVRSRRLVGNLPE